MCALRVLSSRIDSSLKISDCPSDLVFVVQQEYVYIQASSVHSWCTKTLLLGKKVPKLGLQYFTLGDIIVIAVLPDQIVVS